MHDDMPDASAEPATEPADARDPVAMLLSEPTSHLGDILYLHFRLYKRDLVWRLFQQARAQLNLRDSETLRLADVGASFGFDFKYVINRLTDGFTHRLRTGDTHVTLLEGDAEAIAIGRGEWVVAGPACGVTHEFIQAALVRPMPLADNSQHIALCSEVVEHLEEPSKLFQEIHRVLRPGGFLILTTDNSPSALQMARRLPVWMASRYRARYARPKKENELVKYFDIAGEKLPFYGHINLNPTRHWEKLARAAGFTVASFGTYESIRRGGGSKNPFALACYFIGGFLVSILPRRLGRFFGDTTALLLRKPDRGPFH